MTYQTLSQSATPAVCPNPARWLAEAPDMSRLSELTNADMSEAMEFLAIRPVHTVVMTSFINDNGIESTLNRGRFFGYRGQDGSLEGIALIGHTTLIEARSEAALHAFAIAAKTPEVPIHLIMSSGTAAEDFWRYYAAPGHTPRLTCTELLFEMSLPALVRDCSWQIRCAKPEELEDVARAQAEVAFIECGVDPMETDREGFLKRVARRIDQGRIFVVYEDGQLVFKADIIAETDHTIYLEGVYVGEQYRGRGIGSECLARLSLDLLSRVDHITLLSNVSFHGAHKSFLKAGYKTTDQCVTLFV